MKKITLANTRSISLTLRNFTKFPLPLPKIEIKKLLLEFQAGNAKSGEKLLVHNLRFITVIVSQYKAQIRNQSFNINDLMSEATIGFYYAISRFRNPTDDMRGFVSYFMKCVQGHIIIFLQKHNSDLKLPTNFYSKYNSIHKQLNIINDDVEREIAKTEIINELCGGYYPRNETNIYLSNVINSEVDIFRRVKIETHSKKIFNTETADVEFIEEPDFHTCEPDVIKTIHNIDLRITVERILDRFKFRDVCIMKAYFGMYRTTEELYQDILKLEIPGSKNKDFKKQVYDFYVPSGENSLHTVSLFFDITRESVRQTKERIIKRLRHNSWSRFFRDFI